VILLELIAVLIVVTIVGATLVGNYLLVANYLLRLTLDGRIDGKLKELEGMDQYLGQLNEGDETARSIYLPLATKKRDLLAAQLAALRAEKSRREFEEHMKGDR